MPAGPLFCALVEIPSIPAIPDQRLDALRTEQSAQQRIHLAAHAFQAAAYQQRSAPVDPVAQPVGLVAQLMLHVATFNLFPVEQPLQPGPVTSCPTVLT